MKKYLALAALFLLLCGCGKKEDLPAPLPPSESPAVSQPAEPAPPAAEEPEEEPDPLGDMISEMTLAEKVGQLFFVRCPADSAVEDISAYHLSGYVLFGRDTKEKTAGELIETIASYQSASKIPLLIGVDEEGGTVVRVSSNPHLRSSKFQSPQKVFAAGGMEAIIADTQEKDRLLNALGFNVNLAPVADISTHSGDFIYSRSFGRNPEETAEFTSAVTAQMKTDGMGSALKHFPGYGSNVDTHTGIARDSRPLEQFFAEDFLPFSSSFSAGGDTVSVLVSHNIMECVDDALPASLSPAVHELLRKDLGFDGVIMTDDLAMAAVAAYAGDGSVAVMALQAGNDLIITGDYPVQIPKVISAVESGTLSEDLINTACRNVLEWKQALGLI
jgi:beta-N-acetylhexosaminidase